MIDIAIVIVQTTDVRGQVAQCTHWRGQNSILSPVWPWYRYGVVVSGGLLRRSPEIINAFIKVGRQDRVGVCTKRPCPSNKRVHKFDPAILKIPPVTGCNL